MLIDSVGLGFARQGRRVLVHYPQRAADGSLVYGSGMELDYPFRYPDSNAITRERVKLIERLCESDE